MRIIQKIGLVAAVGLATILPAKAQFNYFELPRTIALVYPQTVNAGSSSNFCADIHGYQGIAKLDIVTITNGACSGATLTLYTSPDRTNWVTVSNYAVATSNSVIVTNNYYGGTQLATNIIMYAGTKTYPTASSAGFATPYIVPAPYTNAGGAITLSNGLMTIGFSIPSQARYLQAFYSFTGASTNTISAVLTAKKQQE